MNSHFVLKISIVVLLQFLLLKNSEGFKCYQCFAKGPGSHSACEKPQMSSLKNCSCLWTVPGRQDHQNGSLYSRDTLCVGDLHIKQVWSGCFKAVGVGDTSGEKWISRGCTSDKKNSCQSYKWSKGDSDSAKESYQVNTCQCTGESCNNGQKLTNKYWPLLALVLISFFFLFLSKQ